MATATGRYTFLENTTDVSRQLSVNWSAIIPRVEKTYGNSLLRDLGSKFKTGGTTWEQRLEALRERVRAPDCPGHRGYASKLHGLSRWLYHALRCEAGLGPHPGTSMLLVSIELFKGVGGKLPPKSDSAACTQLVLRALRDFAPQSELVLAASRKRPGLGASSRRDLFESVISYERASTSKCTFAVLADMQWLEPFEEGTGKSESYAL